MSAQKALIIPSVTSPYTLISKPIPLPGPDEVLIKIEGVGLNPAEWKFAMYTPVLEALTFPVYMGSDGAGVVELVGEKIPPTMSTLEAAWLPMALGTAAFGFCLPDPPSPSLAPSVGADFDPSLVTHGRAGAGLKPFWEEGAKGLMEGHPIVVIGGSSSVGQLAIQIAAHYGFSPVITMSSAKHAGYLKSLGATYIVDCNASDPAQTVEAILQSHHKPLIYIFAAVEAVTQAYIDMLAPGGILMTAVPLSPELQYTKGKKQVYVFGLGQMFHDFAQGLSGALEGLLKSGFIKPSRVEKIPGGLAGISGGLERLKKGEVSDPTETP